jgi:hypothetical protein
MGNQGKGSITDETVRKLLALQGGIKPHQIITLMQYPDTDNTMAMADHDDHIHVGFYPTGGLSADGSDAAAAKLANSTLKPGQWDALVERIGTIENPAVSDKPSKASLKVIRKQLDDASEQRAEEAQQAAIDSYDAFQDGVKDPFLPPWVAKDKP